MGNLAPCVALSDLRDTEWRNLKQKVVPVIFWKIMVIVVSLQELN